MANVVQGPQAWMRSWIEGVDERIGRRPAREILAWSLETFAPRIALATSFGPQTIVLMHWVAELRPETTVFYLDTGLLFPETYALRDRLVARLGIEPVRVTPRSTVEQQAERDGPALWARDPDRCCAQRKVAPLRAFLADRAAWITGLRREQSANRAATGALEWDAANGLVKVNPLVGWTREEVWDYLREHDLPYNALHDDGYPSIGCRPCTRAVRPGEPERAGRWSRFSKTECGLHAPRRESGS